MFRYRFLQTEMTDKNNIQSGLSLAPQGYHIFKKGLSLKGWVVAKDAVIDSLQVFVYSSHKRELLSISKFNPSPDIKELLPQVKGAENARFTLLIDAQTVNEITDKRDFALEFVAKIKDKSFAYRTVAFVRDPIRTDAVFVVGSPRSGTSILGNTLSQVLTGENRYGESHILALAHDLQLKIDDYYKGTPASFLKSHMLSEYNRYLLIAQMQNVFKMHYANITKTNVFVDKTPGIPMLIALPSIIQIWPQASVVFAKRRGLENITSRMRKFVGVSFEDHCKQWSRSMTLWQSVKKQLPKQIEIDQYEIQTSPGLVAKNLSRFLKLDADKEAQIRQSFINNRPERTSITDDAESLSLENLDWTEEQKKMFQITCKSVMNIYKYSNDENYYQR